MDEHVTLQVIARIHANDEFVPIVLHYWDILMIFEATTMTLTHPNVSDYNKTYYEQLSKQLELRLKEEFPELEPLLRACWNRQLPMTQDPDVIAKRQEWVDNMDKRIRRRTGRK